MASFADAVGRGLGRGDYVPSYDLASILTGGAANRKDSLNFTPDMLAALKMMLSEAPDYVKSGTKISSGYRSPELQRVLFDAAVQKYGSASAAGKWVAPPGRSAHGKGTAADLQMTPAAKSWIHANAGKYGLSFPMSWEPWHIQSTGLIGKTALAALGFVGPDAVRAFQKANGLDPDNILGPLTAAALLKALDAAPKPPGSIPGIPTPSARPNLLSLSPEARASLRPATGAVAAPTQARPAARGLRGPEAAERRAGAAVPTPRERPALGTLANHIIERGGRIGKNTSPEIVKDLQRFLNARGITDNKGRALTVDGKFGANTKAAVKNLQEQLGVRPDGVIGPRTVAAALREERVAEREAATRDKDDVVTREERIAIAEANTRNKDDAVTIDPETGLPVAFDVAFADRPSALAALTGASIAAGGVGLPTAHSIEREYDPITMYAASRGRAWESDMADRTFRLGVEGAARELGLSIAAGRDISTANSPLAGMPYYDLDMLDVQNALSPHEAVGSQYLRNDASLLGPDRDASEGALFYNATQAYAMEAREQAIAASERRGESSDAFNTPYNNTGSFWGSSPSGQQGEQGVMEFSSFGGGSEQNSQPSSSDWNSVTTGSEGGGQGGASEQSGSQSSEGSHSSGGGGSTSESNSQGGGSSHSSGGGSSQSGSESRESR